MNYTASTPEEYLNQLPKERALYINNLREVILANIPEGFQEEISYNMIGFVVPHSLYPSGYHCNKNLPLPFINLASQKKHIAVYHMGLYADKKLMDWFIREYNKSEKRKLDLGKSCIRFNHFEDIPYDLIGKLASKMTVKDWVDLYEITIKK